MKNKKKFNNYFGNIINKYNLKLNQDKPLVIFLDGRNVTKDNYYSLHDETKNSFNDIMEKTIKYFSKKFNCIAILGVDEVSFIFTNKNKLIAQIGDKKTLKSQDIVSIFSQYFYQYFNSQSSLKTVYWHCKCQTIPKGKIKSYIKYRSNVILNLFTTYYLKRNFVKDAGNISLSKKIELCGQFEQYKEIKEYENGILILNGDRIDIDQYLNGNIQIINKERKDNNSSYLDLTKIDELF